MCISDRVLYSWGLLQGCCQSIQAGLEFALWMPYALFLVYPLILSLPRRCGRSLRLTRAKYNKRLRSGSPFKQMLTGVLLNLRSELLPRPFHCSAGPAPCTQSVSFPLSLTASSKAPWSFRKVVICVNLTTWLFSPCSPTFSRKWVVFFFLIFIKTRVTVKTEKLFAFPGWYKPVYSFKGLRLWGSFSWQQFHQSIQYSFGSIFFSFVCGSIFFGARLGSTCLKSQHMSLSQEDCESEANLGYIIRPCLKNKTKIFTSFSLPPPQKKTRKSEVKKKLVSCWVKHSCRPSSVSVAVT